MKVQCIKLVNGCGKEVDYLSHLKKCEIYNVIEIYIKKSLKIKYRIINLQNDDYYYSPFLVDAENFEIVSNTVPKNWNIEIAEDLILLSPQPWLKEEFWVKFFDGDPESEKIYEEELDKILLTE